ncbi:hypothetical protein EET67_05585 [Pseudaminobacter arsenicus]|uniref:Uncharacterized protein n=1 Tax=Borborobacter arsenicus TaxID=1851146 RepID=A0A432VAD0_9HYPH|nr:hypothetical protein [Pseudaminobacter arsenicus]RUM99104.1 hypothetical protein EET67_05585 [Pseudaminobacter arsenicus]
MPLQNRVDPFGDIHAVDARGMFTGNRGVIHDPTTRRLLKRRWSTNAWIICECEFRGRKREVMGRNAPGGGAGWTELFFLDEVTALSAGHRPCFYCRRERAREFAARIGEAFETAPPRAPEIDARLHRERLASGGPPVAIDRSELEELPDGAMVFQNGSCFAKRESRLWAWTFRGYGDAWHYAELAALDIWLATPATTIAALKAGYKPVWHESAGGVKA